MPTQQTIAISFLLLYGNRSVPNSLFQRGLFGQSIALVLKPCMQHAKTTNTKINHLREIVTSVLYCIHNTAQNSSDNLLSYLSDSRRSSHDVYCDTTTAIHSSFHGLHSVLM